MKNQNGQEGVVDRGLGEGGADNCVSDREREKERGARVANSVCDVGIDQSHRQKGGT